MDFCNKLAQSVDIRELELKMPKLEDISVLENMTYLSNLKLANTSISSVRPIRNITNMLTLDVSNTRISEVYFLKRMTFMESLDISGNEISDFENLYFCENLRYLDVADTGITKSEYEELVNALPEATIVYKHDDVISELTEETESESSVESEDETGEYTESQPYEDVESNTTRPRRPGSEQTQSQYDVPNDAGSENGYWFFNDYTNDYSFYDSNTGITYNNGESGHFYSGEE